MAIMYSKIYPISVFFCGVMTEKRKMRLILPSLGNVNKKGGGWKLRIPKTHFYSSLGTCVCLVRLYLLSKSR